MSFAFKSVWADAGFEMVRVAWDRFEFVPWRHDLVLRVGFLDLSLGIHVVH